MSEFSTELVSAENLEQAEQSVVGLRWEALAAQVPVDLEASAQEAGALQRRRGLRSALVLLRIALAYAVLDWPLRLLGAWCVLQGLADVSDVALLKRLRHCRVWLGQLLGACLRQRQVHLTSVRDVHLRLRDATTISRPGSDGSDWRIHLGLDLGRLCIEGVELTDAKGGESLARFASTPGDIEVADRGYAFASSLGPALAAGAHLVVRLAWQNLPLWRLNGERLDVIAWLKSALADPALANQELLVEWATPEGRFALRLIAGRLPQEAAERARNKTRRTAQRKGRTVDERTLFACGFVLLITNLPARWWSASSVLDLYRVRWQVEMLFKRPKGVLHLDHLRSHDPELSQTYLLGKLLTALLLENLTEPISAQAPEMFFAVQQPASPWRLTKLLWAQLYQCICGSWSAQDLLDKLPRLRRFLCEPPRRRQQQLARARSFLTRLSVVNVPALLGLS